MKTKVAFAAALILAIAAVIGMRSVLITTKQDIQRQGHPIEVVVASVALRPGDVLDPNKFEIKVVAGETARPDDITSDRLVEFEGRKLVKSVPRGFPLNERHFIMMPSEINFTQEVEKSRRAISIAVDQVSGVAGLIVPKDRVDVLATMAYHTTGPGGARSILETVTILENVTVLAVDNQTAEYASIPERYRRDGRRGYTSVTLSVTPEEARIITLAKAQSQGMLTLALRNPADSSSSIGRTNSDDLWNSIRDSAERRRLEVSGVRVTGGQ